MKRWLGDPYLEGDEDLRIAIVNATLEHLFERRAIAKYFRDWKQHPVLSVAYAQGMLWSEEGGKTDLGKERG